MVITFIGIILLVVLGITSTVYSLPFDAFDPYDPLYSFFHAIKDGLQGMLSTMGYTRKPQSGLFTMHAVALGLHSLVTVLTIGLILTDVLPCCSEKFRPTIQERSIRSLLGPIQTAEKRNNDHSDEELEMVSPVHRASLSTVEATHSIPSEILKP